MGPESSGGQMVAYLDGKPMEIGQELPEITPVYSVGGVSVEEVTAAAERLAEVWGGLSMTMEVAADGILAFMYSVELGMAINLARILEPDMASRYIHAKKKRIRKKYEKRIMAWFREVWR